MQSKKTFQNTRILIFILFAIIFSTPSIAGLFDKLTSAPIPTSISYEIIDAKLQSVNSLTQTLENSLLGLEAGLRGFNNKKIQKDIGVNLIGEDIAAMQESIKNLQVISVLLDNIPSATSNSEPLSGYMTFSDEVGRTLQIGFVLLATNTDVTIISLNPVFYGAPTIELFIVPEDELDATTVSAEKNYISLYKNISSKSLNPGSYPTGRKKYYVAAFFKSIVPPGVIVTLKADVKKDGLQGDSRNNKYQFYDDSWLVAIREIETNLTTNTIWAKVTLKPDSKLYSQTKGEEYLVGLFNIGGGKNNDKH